MSNSRHSHRCHKVWKVAKCFGSVLYMDNHIFPPAKNPLPKRLNHDRLFKRLDSPTLRHPLHHKSYDLVWMHKFLGQKCKEMLWIPRNFYAKSKIIYFLKNLKVAHSVTEWGNLLILSEESALMFCFDDFASNILVWTINFPGFRQRKMYFSWKWSFSDFKSRRFGLCTAFMSTLLCLLSCLVFCVCLGTF